MPKATNRDTALATTIRGDWSAKISASDFRIEHVFEAVEAAIEKVTEGTIMSVAVEGRLPNRYKELSPAQQRRADIMINATASGEKTPLTMEKDDDDVEEKEREQEDDPRSTNEVAGGPKR